MFVEKRRYMYLSAHNDRHCVSQTHIQPIVSLVRVRLGTEVAMHPKYDLSSNPSRVELGVLGTSVLSRTLSKNINILAFITPEGRIQEGKLTGISDDNYELYVQ